MDAIAKQCQRSERWPADYTAAVFKEYVRFLYLRSKNESLSPSDDIDKVWHTHILNTRSYAEFCQSTFKQFVHHNPQDAQDQNARLERFKKTLAAYRETFGSDPSTLEPWKINGQYLETDCSDIRVALCLEESKRTVPKNVINLRVYKTRGGPNHDDYQKPQKIVKAENVQVFSNKNDNIDKLINFLCNKYKGQNQFGVLIYRDVGQTLENNQEKAFQFGNKDLISPISDKFFCVLRQVHPNLGC